MATHSSILAWEIPWTEDPRGLQSLGSQRVGHNWATSISLSCIGEGNGNPLQHSCLENPRDGGAWWAAVYGVAQGRTRLKRLSSSSSSSSTIWETPKKALLAFKSKCSGVSTSQYRIPRLGSQIWDSDLWLFGEKFLDFTYGWNHFFLFAFLWVISFCRIHNIVISFCKIQYIHVVANGKFSHFSMAD